MKGFQQKHAQFSLLKATLIEQLNPENPLIRLAKVIPWDDIEKKLSSYYPTSGRRAKPIRLMAGLLILKHLENLSDERLIHKWVENPYYQFFCGYHEFQWKFPCHPTDLIYFRKRIGEEGCREIFKASIKIHKKKALEKEVVIDTTVQEKNITYPTDTKLHLKIIASCIRIAQTECIKLNRTYNKELKSLIRQIRFSKSNVHLKKLGRAKARIKTIAGKLFRVVKSKLPKEIFDNSYKSIFAIFENKLNQQKNSKDKIYSIHEPHVACIAKGKAHKKYEFGSKVSLAMTKTSTIIVGAYNHQGNPHDSKTLKYILQDVFDMRGTRPTIAYCDRGYRGESVVKQTQIKIPEVPKKNATPKEKKKGRKIFGRRSAIEPVIGHVKHDFRMGRNYLKGVLGDIVNMLLAVAAFNFRKWIRALPVCLFFAINSLLSHFYGFRTKRYAHEAVA